MCFKMNVIRTFITDRENAKLKSKIQKCFKTKLNKSHKGI